MYSAHCVHAAITYCVHYSKLSDFTYYYYYIGLAIIVFTEKNK